MSELVLIITGAVSLLSVILIILTVVRGWGKSKTEEEREPGTRRVPVAVPARDAGQVMRRGQRNVRSRMRVATSRQESDEDEDDPLADEIAMPDGKVGAKKRKKLEMKAEKRAAREREIEDREERKQRQQLLDDQRKKEEEQEKMDEAKKAEQEQLEKEEQEKKEYEEYLKMKEAFSVDQEGYEEVLDETQTQNKFQEFINYIQDQKVVLLEELAVHFKLKTQDCVDRVQVLIEQEELVGVLDDRGKFISITRPELEAVAKFIRQRGRLAITELVEASNQLVNLTPVTTASTSVAVS